MIFQTINIAFRLSVLFFYLEQRLVVHRIRETPVPMPGGTKALHTLSVLLHIRLLWPIRFMKLLGL